jgi:hypothetical protein
MSDAKYIGLDVHQGTISVALLDSNGKLVMEAIQADAHEGEQVDFELLEEVQVTGVVVVRISRSGNRRWIAEMLLTAI